MNSDRVSITAQLDMLSDQFDEMWANGTRPDIEQFALRMKSELRAALYELLIPIDIEYRRNLGEHVVAADYLVYGPKAAGIASRELNESTSQNVPEQHSLIRFDSPAEDLLHGFDNRAPHEVQGYRLRRRIRHGSLGQSWIAESPHGQTPLILKLLPFENERRDELSNLALLRKSLSEVAPPYVQQIHESGVTKRNHLYVVSAFADGVPLVEYCDRECLDLDERIQLFVAICQLVENLHRQGLVHGELNTFTVIVQAHRRKISLIDCGVAKAVSMHQRLDEPALFGSIRQSLGVLSYFAPETLLASVVDASSDQYALGALLHELLTGYTPQHFIISKMKDEYPDVVAARLRSNLEAHPPSSSLLPSRVVVASTAPPIPGVSNKQLSRLLRGNLDSIVMKATARDPGDRYESVGHLADELQRHLEGRKVHARKKRHAIFGFARRFFGS